MLEQCLAIGLVSRRWSSGLPLDKCLAAGAVCGKTEKESNVCNLLTSPYQAELLTISAISEHGRTVTLETDLQYSHAAMTKTYDGTAHTLDARSEVRGVLEE